MGLPSIYSNIFFLVPTRPSEVKFHMGHLGLGHMTTMVTMLIHDKYPLKCSSPNQMVDDPWHWYAHRIGGKRVKNR